MMKIFYNICFLLIIVNLLSCGLYRYTSEFKTYTVSASTIQNHVKTLSPDINFQITEKIKTKVNQDPGLKVVEDNPDFQLDGLIKEMNISPFSVGVDNTPYINRVRIIIEMTMRNNLTKEKITKNNLEAFVDYDAKQNFGEIKDSLYNILSDRIADEIYSEFFQNW